MRFGAKHDRGQGVLRRVTLEDFRCFRGPQSVRLAPPTLLVGDNNTAKTSFLALTRAIRDSAGDCIPMFLANGHCRGRERWITLKSAWSALAKSRASSRRLSSSRWRVPVEELV